MSKSTKKQIEQLAKLLAESHALLEQGDAQSRARFAEATRQLKKRGRKLRERELIDMPKPQPPSNNHREPGASQLTFQPRTQNQTIDEGKKNMFAEQTMTAGRSQTPFWTRAMLTATLLAVVLLGVILAGSLLDGDSLSVTFIRSAEDVNQDAFTLYIDEVWNQGNVALLNDLTTENVVYHDTTLADDVVGIDGVSELVTSYRAAMLDFTYNIDAMSIDEDRVWAQITATGTHTNTLELAGDVSIPASMNTATWTTTIVTRFEDGKIAETWVSAGTLGLLEQLGIAPSLQELSTQEQNMEKARRVLEGYWMTPPDEVSNTDVRELYAERFLHHNTALDRRIQDLIWGAVLSINIEVYQRYPDFEMEIINMSAVGDRVVVHATQRGTLSETLEGGSHILPGTTLEPLDEQGEWEWVFIYRFDEEGKIAEEWWFWNTDYIIATTSLYNLE